MLASSTLRDLLIRREVDSDSAAHMLSIPASEATWQTPSRSVAAHLHSAADTTTLECCLVSRKVMSLRPVEGVSAVGEPQMGFRGKLSSHLPVSNCRM